MSLTLQSDFVNSPSLVSDVGPTYTITRTTKATVVKDDGDVHEVSSGVARFDGATYSGDVASGTSNGLLVEEARTNICLQSEDLSTTWTLTNTTISTNSTTAPSGADTADLIIPDSGSVSARISQAFSLASGGTVSFYAKPGGFDYLNIALNNSAALGASFNFNTGVASNAGGSVDDYGIELTSQGFYRAWVTTSTAVSSGFWYVNSTTGYGNVTGDGASGIYAWGFHAEAGTFRTSYIPTLGASVTRNADAVTTTDISWNDASAGSFYVHAEADNIAAAEQCMIEISDGSTSDRIQLLSAATDGSFDVETYTTTGDDGAIAGTEDFVAGTASRAVAGYADDDVIAYLDGTSGGTEATATLPPSVALTTFTIGNNQDGEYWNGLIKEVRYYTPRLTAAQEEDLSNGIFPTFGDFGLISNLTRNLTRDLTRDATG